MNVRSLLAISLLAFAQTAAAQTSGTPTVLPVPDFHFPGNVGRTYKDSDPSQFPQPVQAPKGAPKKALTAPTADIAGRWDVDVQYSRGAARHKLLLITKGNRVEGSHLGRRLEGALTGEVDGDRVRLRSSLPHEGTRLGYRFDGRLQGETIEGEVDLGEYGKARWTARRSGAEGRPTALAE